MLSTADLIQNIQRLNSILLPIRTAVTSVKPKYKNSDGDFASILVHLVVDLTTYATNDRSHLRPQKKKINKYMNKLTINQDVLLRTPITQVRRHIDDLK
jgi:hypothetical protein